MRKAASIIFIAAAGIALCAGSAFAQVSRTFVSGAGVDSAICSRAAPCRTFTIALEATNAGGEVVVLDSAGYGPFTIDKAISITAIGVEAAITVASGDGITINAGPSDVVNLRSLILTGAAGSGNGITFNRGGTLNIQNCVISGFGLNGLNLVPTTVSDINVSDTLVSNNGGGVSLHPTANASAFYEQVQATGNTGIAFFVNGRDVPVGAAAKATARDSIAANNGVPASNDNNAEGAGFSLLGTAATPGTFTIVNSQSTNNSNGISTGLNAGTIVLDNTKVNGNTSSGFFQSSGAVIKSFGNNSFTDNGANLGSLTPIAPQ